MFHYPWLPLLEFEQMYKRIRAVIVPSIWAEPLPYVVSEAILRGRLVIASAVGGIIEQADRCPGVFLVPSGDYHRLAGLMEFVNGLDREAVSDLVRRDTAIFTRRFNNQRIVEQFVNLLQESISTQ